MDSEKPQSIGEIPIEDLKRPKKKSSLFFVIGIVIILLVLFGGTFFVLSQNNWIPQQVEESLVPTPTPDATSSFATPSRYIAVKDGDVVVGSLNSTESTVLIPSQGEILGSATVVTPSSDGQYIAYLVLPEATIAEYQTNPPYEFYGSREYELHVLNTTDLQSLSDQMVAEDMRYFSVDQLPGRSDLLFWQDGKLYYQKPTSEDPDDPWEDFLYDPASNQSSPVKGVRFPSEYTASSPDGDSYAGLSGTATDDSLRHLFTLSLFRGDEETILVDEIMSIPEEISILFPFEEQIFLTREIFPVQGDPNSICYIESVSVPEGTIAILEERGCPPGSSNTAFRAMTVSPDGKYLVATYNEDPTLQTSEGSLFVRELATGQNRMIAEQPFWYDKLFWISDTEVIATVLGGRTYSEEAQVWKIDVATGDGETLTNLSGNELLSVF